MIATARRVLILLATSIGLAATAAPAAAVGIPIIDG